jgi:predicted phosphodiesterase
MKLGIISDIHEDYNSLIKAINHLEKLACNEIICLGDIAGFSSHYLNYKRNRSAKKCWELVLKTCKYIIPGNHDLYAAKAIPKSNPGFDYPANWYDLSLSERENLAQGRVWLYEPTELQSDLTTNLVSVISELQESALITFGGTNIFLSHYLFPDLSGSGSILPPTQPLFSSHQSYIETLDAECFALFGHCHSEGLLLFIDGQINLLPYGKEVSVKGGFLAGVPCLANGRNTPGYTIYNASDNTLTAIPLRSLINRIFR